MASTSILSSPHHPDDTISPRPFKRRKLLPPPPPHPPTPDDVQLDMEAMMIPEKQNEQDDEMAAAAAALIPGLPDHVAQTCLTSIQPSALYSVSHSWRSLLLSSPSFPPYLSLYATLSPTSTSTSHHSNLPIINNNRPPPKPVHFFSFDPIRSLWAQLPPPPPPVNFTVSHRSFLSLNLPIQSVAVNNHLIVVAATDPVLHPALNAPIIFDPATKSWSHGPEISTPRRWCAAGSCSGAVYIASGVGSQFRSSVARSVEKWSFIDANNKSSNTSNNEWVKMREMKDGRLSREAIEAVGCRGKLYMVNVKGNAVKEGFVYDTESDEWEEMKEGMLAGWRGPAAAMNEEEMYVVDERTGALMRYEWGRDAWGEILHLERLKGAEQMTARGGRVCVVNGDGEIVVVDVSGGGGLGRSWVVGLPSGFRASSVHVLPRMMVRN